MKSALIGIVCGLSIALVAVAGGSCGINHKSDDYACGPQTQCASGRTCVDGFCVVNGTIDAPKGDGNTNGCPTGCTSCNVGAKTCTIDCGLTSCTNQVTCPAGYKCDIQCKGDNACRNGVNCLLAASCTVECTGGQSCQGVQCGPGPCDVSCSAQQSCRNVTCGVSCACDVTCTGQQSCQSAAPVCSGVGGACRQGSGCTSVPAACHSCP
jgi:hypothetical protein